ncbi:MAG: tubulin-like doman-containing protein, partial [Pirellulales bacterium]
QLVIVTELADMSLMDRYRACRDAGTGGIPREELLAYLKDAADALDYMSEKYGLQHLDIKPENLLLVGGRVKVADFGLVKDLQDTHATAIGGVTPIYATPEAFDGKASRYSDQYSLAIVYQEMLTGELPFPGGTTAQLANQHLHSQPLLGPLSPQDRPTIARALSKQPEKRFATCRQMVDNLLSPSSSQPREQAAPGSEPAAAGAAGGHAADQHTVSLRATPAASNDETRKYRTAAPSPVVGEVPLVELEPLSLDGQAEQEQPGTRPTLFIGIGGTAGAALRRLRQRLHDRFGSLDAIPTLRFLLLDTDREALHAAQQGDDGEALAPDETLLLALRKPADYRADSDEILAWLSRRWLYNIPRSLRTEGLRPLGRLAYIDHAAEATERFRQALMAATSAESKAAAVQATGHALRDESPRVFIVSSISGGTGSGMLLDVAYTARQMLTDLGYSGDNVCGMMVHGTMLKGAANDLRKANAYATLTELNHFNSHAGAHRGGPLAGLPAGEPSDRPFGDCYLVHLGDGLTEPELALATDKVAQYLYLDAATVCGAV